MIKSKIKKFLREHIVGDDETITTKERLNELEEKELLLQERMEASAQFIELPPDEENKEKGGGE